MAQFKDVIDPKDLKRLMGGPSVINQPSTIEYDTKAFKRADPLAAITGGMRGLEESRALSQGGWELAAKGLGNIVENVVFETLKAPGTIASGIGMATGAEPLINNFWVQSFDAIQKASDNKITEVYVPPSVQDKGLWGQIFNPYFFAGEGADAVGTMLSMMIPGRWMATLGVGDKIAKGLSKAGRLGDLAADGTRMVTELGDANKLGKFMVKTLGATGRGIDFGKLAKNIDSGVAVTVNTLLESSAEALDTYETLLDQGKSPEEASQIASKVLGLNMALLAVSNTLLEKYVFNGFNRMPSVNKQLATALKGGKPVFRPVQQAGVKFGAGVLAEGFVEEGLQTTFQQEEGNFMNSIERYFDNLGSLFGDDPDIEFGKAVFLGGILGGAVGGISGISDVKQQKQLLTGRPARELTGTKGKIQAMLGYKAREAEKGLIDVFLPSFEALKSGKDKLKNSALTAQGKLDPKTLEDETLMFALSNTFDDLVESNNGDITKAKDDLKLILNQEYEIDPKNAGILASKVAPVSNLSSSTAFDLMRAKKDYMYFSRFAAVSGGFEMLDAHIDDMVEAMSDRYMTNTGMQMSEAAKVKLQNDMKLKAKKFKNIYDAGTKYNSNIRFDVEFTEDQRGLFNQFMNIVQTDSLNGMMFKSDLEEQVKALEEETKEVKAEVDRAVSINNNKQQSPDLSKEEKEQAQKEYEQAVSNAKAKVPDYDGKIRDIKLLNTEIQKKSQAVLDNGLASRVKEKWKAFLELQEEATQAKKLFFDGVEIDFTNIVQAMNTIERILRDKGYEPMRDPNTGIVVLDPFYIKQGNKTYIVHAKPEGINYEELGAEPATQKPITWEKFITTRNKATILTPEEFAEVNLEYQTALKEEEDELKAQAILNAITNQIVASKNKLDEVTKSIKSQKAIVETLEKNLADLQDLVKNTRASKKGGLTAKNAKEIKQRAKEQIKEVEKEIDTATGTINWLNIESLMLEGEVLALENLKVYLERNRGYIKGKTFEDIYTRQEFESLAAPLEPDDVSKLTQMGITAMNYPEKGNLADFLAASRDMLNELNLIKIDADAIKSQLKNIEVLLNALIAEIDLGTLVGQQVPDNILSKYPGLAEALASNDSKVLLDYLSDIASSTPGADYLKFVKEFTKSVSPYLPLSIDNIRDYQITISQELVDRLNNLRELSIGGNIESMLTRFAVVELRRKELEKLRQNEFNKLKKTGKPFNQQAPGWDLDSSEPGYNEDVDESVDKVPYLFHTSGLNLQYDPTTGKVLYEYIDVNIKVPTANENIYQQTFFTWLDSKNFGDGFKVLPYAPKFDDTDFNDITDATTASRLREAIGTASDKANALYTVILNETGTDVLSYNGVPLINAMMLPDTKFPATGNTRMARRAVISEFLSDVYNQEILLKTKDLSRKSKIKGQDLELLANYGITNINPGITYEEFFKIIEPFAKVYVKEKYSKELTRIREQSMSEVSKGVPVDAREKLQVLGRSNGKLVTAKDENNKDTLFPLANHGLKYNAIGKPVNFTLIKGNRSGMATSLYGTEFTNLKPGGTYVEFDDKSGIIPVQMRNLTSDEVDVVMFMLNKLETDAKSLEVKFDNLEGSLFYDGKDVKLNTIPMLPSGKDRVSLMSFLINWGFKSKDANTPYDIYISKGHIIFGSDSKISLRDFKKAYKANDEVTLQPLRAFLLNKRLNANHKLLNNNTSKFYTLALREDSKGEKQLVSVQRQGTYANYILSDSFTYAIPESVRQARSLPMFAQRYLYFKQGTKIDAEVFKQEVSTRKASFTPKPGTPQAAGQTKMQEFREKLDTVTNEEQYSGLIGTYSSVSQILNLVTQVVTLPTFQEKVTKLKELIDGKEQTSQATGTMKLEDAVESIKPGFMQAYKIIIDATGLEDTIGAIQRKNFSIQDRVDIALKTGFFIRGPLLTKQSEVVSIPLTETDIRDAIAVMEDAIVNKNEGVGKEQDVRDDITALQDLLSRIATQQPSAASTAEEEEVEATTEEEITPAEEAPATQPPVINPEMNRLSNKNLSTTEGIIKTGVLEEASLINIDKVVAKDNDGDVRMYVNADKLNGVLLARNGKVLFRSMQGRFFILAKVGNFYLPFYQSSAGTSGKVQGAWYPFFGYNNWLVKGSVGKKGEMEYSKQIDEVTRLINENLKLPASKEGNSYLTQFGQIITGGGTPANPSKVLYDINNDLGYESWYVEFDRKKNNTYTEEQFIKDRTGFDPINVVNNGKGSANAWINNIIELIEDAEKASKGVIKNIGKSATTSTDILDDLLESDEGTLYLKRDPKSTLETALNRGIIDKVNCK